MSRSATALVAFTCSLYLAAAGCGGSDDAPPPRAVLPAPAIVLTPEEQEVWAPLPPDRSAIPVLVYHGVGPEENFANAADAAYGVGFEDFARQMTMIAHAGYETVDLETFVRFVRGDDVELPARPLLLTFDDARADSWTGADAILAELGFDAVMFVDVGRVENRDPEYSTWEELDLMQASGRWAPQLHSGEGHQQIRHGPGDDDFGPYYAYRKEGESFEDWQKRVREDIDQGEATLAEHVPGYEPFAFAPPYGSYGQDGTNDERIPDNLLGFLTSRFDVVFVQDVNVRAKPGDPQPLGRLQVTRTTTGGEVYDKLLTG